MTLEELDAVERRLEKEDPEAFLALRQARLEHRIAQRAHDELYAEHYALPSIYAHLRGA